MSSLAVNSMRSFLSKSMSSLNRNKLNGLLAEIDFRAYLTEIGYGDRVSIGGWIARSVGAGVFGHETVVIFPEIIEPDKEYSPSRALPAPTHGLHTICSTFHQIGIRSLFCAPVISEYENPESIMWKSVQLGLPIQQEFKTFPESIEDFSRRTRRYNFLRYKTDSNPIPDSSVPEEFTKEHIRVAFQTYYLQEMSDVDGILWGNQYTYPLEIKEKTAASDSKLGEYFGLDLGPFVKLAFYAAKRGNLHSIFIVREINNIEERALVNWWYITFDKLAQFASWVPQGGGRNMQGGGSTVVKIPKCEFQMLNKEALGNL